MARKTKGRLTKEEHVSMYRKQSLTGMYFNRYLMIRYFFAIFFFSNFFWAYMAWGHWSAWIPSILLLLSILPMVQLGLMYGKKPDDVKTTATRWFFWAQWAVCIMMMILAWSAPMSQIWPMFTDTDASRLVLFGIFFIGFILSSVVLYRFYKISRNVDKAYGRIQFFENKYKIRPGQ